MNNLRVIMVLCFVTAFSAGIMVGKLWERSIVKADPGLSMGPPPPGSPTHEPGSARPPQQGGPLGQPGQPGWVKDLNLTFDQSEKMRAIWSEVMKNGPMNHERRDAIRKERDDAIRTLMTDEQRKQQSAIMAQFDAKNDEIGRQMRSAQETQRKQRDDAVKAIFDGEQRKQYEAALAAYASKTEELSKDWKKSFDDAVERTRALLTPEQRVKYDDYRKKREEQPHRHFAPDWPGDNERHPGMRPDSRNAPKQ